MRICLTTVLLVPLLCTASYGADHRIISLDEGSVTVEFVPGSASIEPMMEASGQAIAMIQVPGYRPERIEGRPALPVRRFLFEVPAERGIRLQVVEIDVSTVDGILPEVWFSEVATSEKHLAALSDPAAGEGRDFAVLAGVQRLRKRYIALVDIYPFIYDPASASLRHAERIVVRLSFPPRQSEPGRGRAARAAEDRVIVNSDQAAAWRSIRPESSAQQRTPYEFTMSDKWLKLTVSATGIHSVSYEDLFEAGVDPLQIDPATLRLFSQGPLQQPYAIDDGGSFEEDHHMTEHPILYEGAGTGSMMPGESIIFYGVAASGWANALDPGADRRERYEHRYSTNSAYWLTWGGSFEGEAARVGSRSVAPGGSHDFTVDTYEHRLHSEQDRQYDSDYTDDGWYWDLLGPGSAYFENDFFLSDVTDGTGSVRLIGYGPYNDFDTNEVAYSINEVSIGTLRWRTTNNYFYPVMLEAAVTGLHDLFNEFRADRTEGSKAYILWYDIFYRRDLEASGGALDFFAPLTPGTALFEAGGFTSDEIVLFDVTAYDQPVLLTGFTGPPGPLSFEDTLDGEPVHYVATVRSQIRIPGIEVTGETAGDLPSLRDIPYCPDMVIVYHSRFRDAAQALASYRMNRLPHSDDPVVMAVDIDDIYDNFSGGMKDPVAIRNYMKFLYDNFSEGGLPVIKYLLLFGNGNYDAKDILGIGTDYIPIYMNDYGREVVEDEDFYVRLDEGRDLLIDLGVGRMPVLSAQEAQTWVDHIIRYETQSDQGEWRNKVVLVADDEFSARTDCDYQFINDMEVLTESYKYFPGFIDFRKIYMHLYPHVGSLIPSATSDLLAEWNSGALVVNYIGHGSSLQMADERVMQKSDIYSLMNGTKKPLYLAFSCYISNIESPYQRSMGQEMVGRGEGGAIAVMGGSGGTLGIPNRDLCHAFFDNLFTSEDGTGTEPLGIAMMLAKPCCASLTINAMNNAQNLTLGDPAMSMAVPAYTVEFDLAGVDTMYTGLKYRIDGSVIGGGSVLSSFNGSADVVIREPRTDHTEIIPCYTIDTLLTYYIPGNRIFRGTVDVTAGRFSTEFVIPLRCRSGSTARIRTYVRSDDADGVGAADTLTILNNPDIPDNEGPPDINIYFAGQATKVKEGATMVVEISDPDGIAMLGTDPQSSIFLEFDRSGYPIFVTDYFAYDHNSSTSGKVEYPLPSGFSPGPHSVTVRAFDNLGESATDTLYFDLVEAGLYTVSDVFNMPNPFTESTNFVFQLSSDADVVLRVYNLSGQEIWHRSVAANEGFNSIFWDGRDFAGDRPANGTYLYILDVSFRNSYNRSETVRGKAVLLR